MKKGGTFSREKIITVFIWVLGLMVLGVLFSTTFGSYLLLTASHEKVSLSQRWGLLPAVTVSAGVLVAILTFSRERRKQEIERQRHTSEVLLDRASQGFRAVIDLLSDRNNNREIWNKAARTLLRSLKLKSEIKAQEYVLACELEEEKIRSELSFVLSIRDGETAERKPLPPQFFYGIKGWETCNNLDEAAVKASQDVKVYSVSIDEVWPLPSSMPIEPEAVIAIFGFLEYPEAYLDPLDSIPLWDNDWTRHTGIDQGARRYVAHRKQKIAIGGELFERNTNPPSDTNSEK